MPYVPGKRLIQGGTKLVEVWRIGEGMYEMHGPEALRPYMSRQKRREAFIYEKRGEEVFHDAVMGDEAVF